MIPFFALKEINHQKAAHWNKEMVHMPRGLKSKQYTAIGQISKNKGK